MKIYSESVSNTPSSLAQRCDWRRPSRPIDKQKKQKFNDDTFTNFEKSINLTQSHSRFNIHWIYSNPRFAISTFELVCVINSWDNFPNADIYNADIYEDIGN